MPTDSLNAVASLASFGPDTLPPTPLERFLDGLQSPGGIYALVLLTCVAALFIMRHAAELAVKESIQVVLRKHTAYTELQTQHEHVLRLLRERDELLGQHYALRTTNATAHRRWKAANWKSIARQQLALTKCIRPLCYTDYRNRVWAISPTYAAPARPVLSVSDGPFF